MRPMVYNGVKQQIMKKVFTILTAIVMLTSVSFAQNAARKVVKPSPTKTVKVLQKQAMPATKDADDPISTFPWTEGFETTPLTGFTFIDADGDGYNWAVMTTSVDHFNAHEGDGVVASASFGGEPEAALTPDNWMILPAFELPTDADDLEFSLSWYESGQDPSYADEYYSVYVCTTGNTVQDFTATTAVLTSTSTAEWVKKSVSLADYAGETIYIAFRHHNVTDMFYLNIDDIRIGGAEPPVVTINGPASAHTGDTVVFTAITDASEITWSISESDYEDSEDNTAIVVWESAGTYTVSVDATNVAGTTTASMNVTVVDCSQPISEFPYTDGFESGIGCWVTYSADPANDAEFIITDQTSYNESGHSFQFSSYASAESENYNQYLVSPELNIAGSTVPYMVSFKYLAQTAGDVFRVLASTTTNDTSAFTQVLFDMTEIQSTDWTEFACTIPSETKYICINYYGNYAYYLYIDDFTVSELTAPSVVLNGPTNIGTSQEGTYTAISTLAESFEWTVDGTAVEETGNVLTHTFTTPGAHTISVTATNTIGSNSTSIDIDVFDCSGTTLPYAPDFTEGLHCWSTRQDLSEGYGWFASVDMFEADPMGQVLSLSADNFFGMFIMDAEVDNWLFSPVIEMPEGGSFDIAWKVMPIDPSYSADHYAVYVISGGEETMLFQETLDASITSFHQRVASIPAEISGEFQIAFRHFDNPGGGYVVILDDIQIVNAGSVTGIDDVNTLNIAIYPNPVSNVLNVEGEDIQQVEILDLNGRTVLATNESGAINISNLASGMYLVRAISAEGVRTVKIVKK